MVVLWDWHLCFQNLCGSFRAPHSRRLRPQVYQHRTNEMERLEPLDQKPRGGRNDGHWSGGNTLLRSMKWLSHAKSNSPGWSAWKSKIFFSGLIMFSAALCGQYLGNSAIRPGFDMSYSFWYGWTKLDMSLSFYWKTQLLTGGFRFVCVFFFFKSECQATLW